MAALLCAGQWPLRSIVKRLQIESRVAIKSADLCKTGTDSQLYWTQNGFIFKPDWARNGLSLPLEAPSRGFSRARSLLAALGVRDWLRFSNINLSINASFYCDASRLVWFVIHFSEQLVEPSRQLTANQCANHFLLAVGQMIETRQSIRQL